MVGRSYDGAQCIFDALKALHLLITFTKTQEITVIYLTSGQSMRQSNGHRLSKVASDSSHFYDSSRL